MKSDNLSSLDETFLNSHIKVHQFNPRDNSEWPWFFYTAIVSIVTLIFVCICVAFAAMSYYRCCSISWLCCPICPVRLNPQQPEHEADDIELAPLGSGQLGQVQQHLAQVYQHLHNPLIPNPIPLPAPSGSNRLSRSNRAMRN